MIPITGLATPAALKLVDATRDQQLEMIGSSTRHARAIDTFRERVGGIETVEDLLADQDVYAFVMRAYDLEDQIFGKALVGKVLEGDITDSKALINRLTDPRMRELYTGLGFTEGGTKNANTLDPAWQEAMVDRYVEQHFINAQADQNATVGVALEFRRAAPEISTWMDVLKDADLSTLMRTALGVPSSVAQLDIDKQAELFARKFDITKLQDPAEVEKLVRKYAIISDALSGSAASNSAAVQMLSNSAAGMAGSYVPITLDISAITSLPSAPYR
ncbi:hypothetical protein OG2516_06756 [Oceanicola granulosus HTCC2516]|uniref:Flagellar basal-body rod protein FlgF n=1 Tax=Oceanicola granulosus (strain ATCC BAA-861 / DSM 15982 / KCTC 12143 / HTCC2516) TaxID=314256 RepID=Q2CGH5_OCEGH|nr:DUF1217 domain-containing protein [Oceanicola granulosus]EAR51743.1 hypothetical protein OG2516_06756 [Oceanicola granulosus HTCC2516]